MEEEWIGPAAYWAIAVCSLQCFDTVDWDWLLDSSNLYK